MWLIAGLGNPGSKYTWTRHNIGFLAIDRFAESLHAPAVDKKEHQALTCKFRLGSEEVILAKPQTFMNLSGESVQKIMSYYNIPIANLAVIHDEVDQPYGTMKIQKARGHGGHNGIRNIHQLAGSNDYVRFRLGVGRSRNPRIDTATHVLQKFDDIEMNTLGDFLDLCGDALEKLVDGGFEKSASEFSGKKIGN